MPNIVFGTFRHNVSHASQNTQISASKILFDNFNNYI